MLTRGRDVDESLADATEKDTTNEPCKRILQKTPTKKPYQKKTYRQREFLANATGKNPCKRALHIKIEPYLRLFGTQMGLF